ncbi:MAG: diaminopimelate decarboxylase [Synergistaceae bacterium]|jgi:diaminopimelate decarboxylase|nr:diaminopimelate decarboxylase [Synergistaceae bacterium]
MKGALTWGGVDCVELARRFGTPLYVFDESVIRARCAEIREAFLERWPGTSACYASKAFLTMAMARIVKREGLGLDVVSGGELHTALAAGFPPSRIELHGNAKSEGELRAALAAGVGRIIVDGVMELELLAALTAETGRRADVLIRVAPGVTPHTHAHIVTGHAGSKFGLPIEGGLLEGAVKLALASPGLTLRGFHFHIGSQIFEENSHVESVRRVAALMGRMKSALGYETEELNFGGGFGVGKMPDVPGVPGAEPHAPLCRFTDAMMKTLERAGPQRPVVTIEPGRWVVAEAGITLYTVETVKRLPGVTYVGVDGGMPDNPRPALYQAEYAGLVANKADVLPVEQAAIAGKCCETGDILISSIALPPVERGDLFAVFNTGAYNFSMAGNYNRLPRPAVVLARNGQANVIVARQSYDDLLAGERIPEND